MKKNILLIIIIPILIIILYFLFFFKNTPEVVLTVTNKNISMNVNEDKQIEYTLENGDNNLVTFESINENALTVSKTGLLHAIKSGVTQVVVKYNNLVEIVTITINKEENSINNEITYEIEASKETWNTNDVKVKVMVSNSNTIKKFGYVVNCKENCSYIDISNGQILTFSENGEYNLSIVAIDNNGKEVKKELAFKIDKDMPIIEYSLKSGNYEEKKNLTINVKESVSKVKEEKVLVYKDTKLVNQYNTTNNLKITLTEGSWKIMTEVTGNNGLKNVLESSYVINEKGYSIGPGSGTYSRTITYMGRTFKEYKQDRFNHPFWRSEKPNGNIKENGCAPIAISNVLSGYVDINPLDVADYMGEGTFDAIGKAAARYGLRVIKIEYYNSNDSDESKIKRIADDALNHLKKGGQLIALVHGASNCEKYGCVSSKFSVNNHFMAIVGVKKDNSLLIANPGGGSDEGTLDEILRHYMPGGRKGFMYLSK